MSFAPTPHAIGHIVRYEDTSQDDGHGNYLVVDEAPVVRYVYDISQFGRRGSSRVIQGTEFQDRTDTTVHLSVPDPTLFSSNDQIILNPELDPQGNYVDGIGEAFWVDGDPAEDQQSPWPRYTNQMGGVIRARRTT